MKKQKILITSLVCATILTVGCSKKSEQKSENNVPNVTDQEKLKESKEKKEYTFKNGKATMEDVEITITKYKVIPVGEEGNQYGKNPVIAFWYDTTNISGKDIINPTSAWFAFFGENDSVVQDNDKNKINKLQVGISPDITLSDNGSVTIKKDGTVSYAIAYELTDTTTPVVLKAYKGYTGKLLGEQEFKIDSSN